MLDYQFLYIISVPIYILFIIFLIWKKVNIKKLIISSLFYFYIIALIAVTLFPIPTQWLSEIAKYKWENNNFIPFLSILDILYNNNLDIFIKIKQIVGNIVLFVPMWFFIPLIWKVENNFKKALLIAFSCSFSIELLQYIISLLLWFSYKVTDIDDILLNTWGFVLWFFLYRLIFKLNKWKK